MPAAARALVPGEEAMVEAFLATRPSSTVFLRSNLARKGLSPRDPTVPFTGTWVGAFDRGALVGVASLFWNGNMVLSAGAQAGFLARSLVDALATPATSSVAGLLGPWDEVVDARCALGMVDRPVRHVGKEILYAVDVADVVVPELLASGKVSVRLPTDAELPAIEDWRMTYSRETSGVRDTDETRAQLRPYLDRCHREGDHFVAELDGRRVAYSAFNAALPDIVQIGGVYTPAELRSRGYARCVVAGSLVIAKSRGVTRSVLFTREDNLAAQAAYESIGFRRVGDYGIVFFEADNT